MPDAEEQARFDSTRLQHLLREAEGKTRSLQAALNLQRTAAKRAVSPADLAAHAKQSRGTIGRLTQALKDASHQRGELDAEAGVEIKALADARGALMAPNLDN